MNYKTLLILSTIVLLSSCKKEGCKDTNSVSYDQDATKHDGFCEYAYITNIQVNKIPLVKSKGSTSEKTWDEQAVDIIQSPDEQYPDIEIRLIKINYPSSIIHYSKTFHNNKYYPISTELPVFEENFIELNSSYRIVILDIDQDGSEEIASSFLFEYKDVVDGKYVYSYGSVEIIVYFEIR